MRLTALSVVCATVTGLVCALAGCTPAASPGGSAQGKPVYGGTLRVISNAGPGSLDPVPTYNYAGYELERGYTRQLVTYPTTSPAAPSGAAWARGTTLVPDAAARVPSVANGGITGHGLVYTYHIRPGVQWGTRPPRQVTAADFIREFKRSATPASSRWATRPISPRRSPGSPATATPRAATSAPRAPR